jgi:phospholipid/cholesterol/gamma-HCH transport system permease protein
MAQAEKATARIDATGQGPHLKLAGEWVWSAPVPLLSEVVDDLAPTGGTVVVDGRGLGGFDSTLTSYLFGLVEWAEKTGCTIEWCAVPEDLQRMLGLAAKVPDRLDAKQTELRRGLLETVGEQTLDILRGAYSVCVFTGAYTEALGRILIGRSRMRWQDFWQIVQKVGVDALPIVALISFLVGLIISFLGAVTLKQFAAEFAVAYLVGYGMLREMGAIMTGVIMAGRTGSAFAAEIGSMKVNEELDALRTFGVSPIDYLVVPRMLAMVLMMPLLTAFSNVIGIFGGWVVADLLIGLPTHVFFADMNDVVVIGDLLIGLFKGTVFGYLIATAGCLRGLQCGSGAGAVGVATTRAVVTSITLIIIATAAIDWAAAMLGI